MSGARLWAQCWLAISAGGSAGVSGGQGRPGRELAPQAGPLAELHWPARHLAASRRCLTTFSNIYRTQIGELVRRTLLTWRRAGLPGQPHLPSRAPAPAPPPPLPPPGGRNGFQLPPQTPGAPPCASSGSSRGRSPGAWARRRAAAAGGGGKGWAQPPAPPWGLCSEAPALPCCRAQPSRLTCWRQSHAGRQKAGNAVALGAWAACTGAP